MRPAVSINRCSHQDFRGVWQTVEAHRPGNPCEIMENTHGPAMVRYIRGKPGSTFAIVGTNGKGDITTFSNPVPLR